MGSRRVLAIAAGLLAAGLAITGEAGATASDFYGNNFDENVLVPFAECGPGGIDTLIAITDPTAVTPAASGLHVILFNDRSQPVCDFDVPFTNGDVFPTNFCGILTGSTACSSTAARAALTLPPPAAPGSFRAYITFELCAFNGANCTADRDIGDNLYGNIYFTDLGNNRATGLPAATFDPLGNAPFDSNGPLTEFPIFDVTELSFRFLQALDGNAALASTRAIVWSATTATGILGGGGSGCFGSATLGGIGPVPDSLCLGGSGRTSIGPGEFFICDEEENCDSIGVPPLDREINVFQVDNLIGLGFPTDGGYFNLQPIGAGATNGIATQISSPLHVIGITDQEGLVAGQPAVRAAFYAPRD